MILGIVLYLGFGLWIVHRLGMVEGAERPRPDETMVLLAALTVIALLWPVVLLVHLVLLLGPGL